ncbi:type IV secretory system conjugative DNA transfer family protein, partial [Hyphomonas sp.]|uniref:type IV secretory system conjugative DNA transfer family protein n=1 Tax=Hyphomonas sp. TaxID=87 RepID=UPI00391A99EA
EGSRLLVGWSMELEHTRQPIGFSFGDPALNPATGYIDPILMEDEGHLMTIAPTGAGKGRGCIIPALLRYDGPVIVIDPKGENALVTARRRRELGHQVAIVDPIGITGLETTAINPLDLLDADSPTLVDDAMAVISTMMDNRPGRNTSDGDYWSERGATFVLGIVLHVLSDLPEGRRHLGTVRELVAQAMGEVAIYSNMTENAEMRGKRAPPDTVLGRLERSRNAEAARIGQMLRLGAVSTLGGILSFSQSIVEIARGDAITQSLSSTGFDFDGITRGDPISIYLVLPPHMLDSHAKLIRLWVHTLMTLITRRNARPKHSTLFILDEASQLGTFIPLRRAITLMRGYGMQTWSFWQDPSQLVNLYPNDWQTMVNNCRAVQCFGANTMLAAEAMCGIVGFRPADRLLDLSDHEMLLQLKGDAPIVARLPDYRNDPAFEGMFDENPFHDPDRPVIRPEIERVVVRQKTAEPGAEGETVEVLPAQDLVTALRRRRQPKPPAKEAPGLFPEDEPEPDTPSADTPPPEKPSED